MTPQTAKDMAAIHSAAFARQRPWSPAEINALLADGNIQAVTRPGAFGLVRVVAGEAEILTLAVLPDEQRQGRGRAVLAEMLTQAQNSGAAEVFLEVAASNAAARALYANAGFAEAGFRSNYYRYPDGGTEDAVVLRVSLIARA